MASEFSDPSPSEDSPQEDDPRIPATAPEASVTTGEPSTKTKNHRSDPPEIPATGERLTDPPSQAPKQSAPSSAEGVHREESPSMITAQELTDVIVWAVRHLAPIEARLDRYGVLDLVGNCLLEQQADLLWLLARPPQQVLKELGAVQRQKTEDLRQYREQRRQEEVARLMASLADQDGKDND